MAATATERSVDRHDRALIPTSVLAEYNLEVSAETVLKTGAFLYDGRVRCPVRVVQTDFLPGSGDHEDPPELADDQPGTWFRVDLTAAGEPTRWSSSIIGFKTLDDAIAHCATLAIVWDE